MDCIIDKNGYYCLGYDCSKCEYKGDNKMKFDWNNFKNKLISVNCRTKKESEDFLNECKNNGINIDGCKKEINKWEKIYKENTCYGVVGNRLYYNDIYFEEKNNIKIIIWSNYMKKSMNINEVFECEDGTEFDVESEKDLKNGKRVLLKDGALVYKTYHSKVGINKNILNAKFYKIEQPKPVLFMEAIKEYRKGKTMYCILDGEKSVYKYNKGFLSDTQGMAISDIEILNGKWYVKEY